MSLCNIANMTHSVLFMIMFVHIFTTYPQTLYETFEAKFLRSLDGWQLDERVKHDQHLRSISSREARAAFPGRNEITIDDSDSYRKQTLTHSGDGDINREYSCDNDRHHDSTERQLPNIPGFWRWQDESAKELRNESARYVRSKSAYAMKGSGDWRDASGKKLVRRSARPNKRGIWVYSVYYVADHGYLVVLGVMDRQLRGQIRCVLHYGNGLTVSSASRILRFPAPSLSVLINCPPAVVDGAAVAPDTLAIVYVQQHGSLTVGLLHSGASFPVALRSNAPVQRLHQGAYHTFVLCVTTVVRDHVDALYLVEYLSMHQILGVDKIVMYASLSAGKEDSAGRRILRHFEHNGLLDLHPWKLTDRTGRHVLVNDCLHRYRQRAKYLAVYELDEIIVPRRNDDVTWGDLFNVLLGDHRHVAGFYIRRVVFPTRMALRPTRRQTTAAGVDVVHNHVTADNLVFATTTGRRAAMISDRPKRHGRSVYMPSKVLYVGEHAVEDIQYGCRVVDMSSDVAMVHHYSYTEEQSSMSRLRSESNTSAVSSGDLRVVHDDRLQSFTPALLRTVNRGLRAVFKR